MVANGMKLIAPIRPTECNQTKANFFFKGGNIKGKCE